jgi:hypothetical protein
VPCDARTDRIFDRDDVPRLAAIDFADERRQRRRLAGSGRTANQNETARRFHELRQHRRQIQLADRRDRRRQRANGGGQRAALAMDVDAKAPRAAIVLDRRLRQPHREIRRAIGVDALTHAAREEGAEERVDVVGGEGGAVAGNQASRHPINRMRAREDQQIARAAACHLDEEAFNRIAARNQRRRPGGKRGLLFFPLLIGSFTSSSR